MSLKINGDYVANVKVNGADIDVVKCNNEIIWQRAQFDVVADSGTYVTDGNGGGINFILKSKYNSGKSPFFLYIRTNGDNGWLKFGSINTGSTTAECKDGSRVDYFEGTFYLDNQPGTNPFYGTHTLVDVGIGGCASIEPDNYIEIEYGTGDEL